MFNRICSWVRIHRKILVALFVCALVAAIGLITYIHRYYVYGHDTVFHIATIEGLAKSTDISSLFNTRIVGGMMGNFGYGVGIFYPQLAHVITLFIHAIITAPLGLTVLYAAKIAHFLFLFASGVLMYVFAKRICGRHRESLIIAAVYILLPYHLSDIIIRDTFGEELLFVFLPLLGISLKHLVDEEYRLFLITFIISCVGLVNSHLVMTMWIAAFCALFCILNHKLFFTKKKIVYLIVGLVLVFIASANFILPIIEQKLHGNIMALHTDYMTKWLTNQRVYVDLKQILLPITNANGVPYALNIIAMIVMLYYVIANKKLPSRYRRPFLSLFIINVIMTILMLGFTDYQNLPGIIKMIQFFWRLLTIFSFTLCMMLAMSLNSMPQIAKKIVLICMVLIALIGVKQTYVSVKKEGWYNTDLIMEISKTYREYLPVASEHEREGELAEGESRYISYVGTRDDSIHIDNGSADISNLSKFIPRMSFSARNVEDASMELPLIYYSGYRVMAKYGDGHSERIPYKESENGMMELRLTEDADISIDYPGTNLMQATRAMMYVSIGILIFLIVREKRMREMERIVWRIMLIS